MNKKRGGVYMLLHRPTMSVYVGRSRDMMSRVSNHSKQLREGRHPNPRLQGLCPTRQDWADWSVLVLERLDPGERPEAEQEWYDFMLGDVNDPKYLNQERPRLSGNVRKSSRRGPVKHRSVEKWKHTKLSEDGRRIRDGRIL